MSDQFYGIAEEHQVDLNLETVNNLENPVAYNIPFLFGKYLDVESSRMFAKAKYSRFLNFMERGYVPNALMSDVHKAESHYQILSRMFKLD